ncbi:ribosomal-processing cysteine protease Prp [Paenibacillus humicola]|uniref:ribosomal-processing cysteine protease Prp n=1 Tax=Paenibacillus humicola TaxID=3110540 RepID=UPI00237B418D|nr:ribosomal-processing cysteine protease Prp [Paenibacillus humicola]
MIAVTITRAAADKRILSFAIEGHAEYAKRGKDIVCAGVSAVSVGTVNAIESLAGVELPYSVRNGWLQSDIPKLEDPAVHERVQLLLESMIVMLESIAGSYGKFVVIREQYRS